MRNIHSKGRIYDLRPRNFSMQTYWNKLAEDWEPLLEVQGHSAADWSAWQQEASARFMELLGPFPKPVPLEPSGKLGRDDD